MSRVYFHTPSGEAELHGSERAWLSTLCRDVTVGLLNLQHNGDRIREIAPGRPGWPPFPEPMEFAAFQQWCRSMELAITAGGAGDVLYWKDKPIDSFDLVLNTACRVGGDPLKLAARIHGQCEIHGWCDGKDRAWLASIINDGLRAGLFRRGLRPELAPGQPGEWQSQGWENVTRLLRSRDDEPVVMSYSVCDQFPNQYVADWEPSEGAGEDAWYDLPDDEQWRIAMDALRSRRGQLRLSPDDWDTYYFGHGLSVLDIIAADRHERLDRALADEDP